MNVLIVTSWFPNEFSPTEGIFVRSQAEILARRHDVRVAYLAYPRWKSKPRVLQRTRARYEEEGGLMVYCEPVRLPSSAGRLHLRELCRSYRAVLEAAGDDGWEPDLIYAHNLFPAGWLTSCCGGFASAQRAVMEHSSGLRFHIRMPWMRSLLVDAVRRIDHFFCVGEVQRTLVENLCPDRSVDVVGNPIETDFFRISGAARLENGESRFTWFSLGNLVKGKGFEELLDAVSRTLARGLKLELRIAGVGPGEPKLRQKCRDLGLGDEVAFLGRLSREEIRREFGHSDAFVLASRYETFGMVYAEALASGLPVVATRCGGPEDFVTERNGRLVPVGDVNALSMAMEAVMRDVTQFDPVACRQEIVERFSEEAFLDRFGGVAGHPRERR